MKLPEAVYYQFMIYPGCFSSAGQLDNAMITFFNRHGLEVQVGNSSGNKSDRPIMWIYPKKEIDLPKTPQGTPIKMNK